MQMFGIKTLTPMQLIAIGGLRDLLTLKLSDVKPEHLKRAATAFNVPVDDANLARVSGLISSGDENNLAQWLNEQANSGKLAEIFAPSKFRASVLTTCPLCDGIHEVPEPYVNDILQQIAEAPHLIGCPHCQGVYELTDELVNQIRG